jgi:hypothetical protein
LTALADELEAKAVRARAPASVEMATSSKTEVGVTEAIYGPAFNSNARFYQASMDSSE